MKDDLGMRMKNYEKAIGNITLPKTPVIIRVDGVAFHTFTKNINVDNDPTSAYGPSEKFHNVMQKTALNLCSTIQNAVFAYHQSDEISILLRDNIRIETQQWFNGKVQKMSSVSAAKATAYFNYFWAEEFPDNPLGLEQKPVFDSRVFNLPEHEVINYFVWRQKDAIRNSVNSIARKFFSHKQLNNKKKEEVVRMLQEQHNIDWNDYHLWAQRGAGILKNNKERGWIIDNSLPIFSVDRYYINYLMEEMY